MNEDIIIREAMDSDLGDVLMVERLAFGEDDEAELVRNLLDDFSAKSVLSLLVFKGDQAVGHILFTRARLSGENDTVSLALLAPLAVVPEFQKMGIGGALIGRGLELLGKSGVDLVFT